MLHVTSVLDGLNMIKQNFQITLFPLLNLILVINSAIITTPNYANHLIVNAVGLCRVPKRQKISVKIRYWQKCTNQARGDHTPQ